MAPQRRIRPEPSAIEAIVKYAIVVLALATAAASAQPSTDRQGQRWVCVPTEDRGWRCGRGAQAPEPTPLPPERPAGPPPSGYEPRTETSRLPDYLRQSMDPTSAEEEPAPSAPPDGQPRSPAAPEPEIAGESGDAETVPDPEIAGESGDAEPIPDPEIAEEPGDAEPAQESRPSTGPGPEPARYGIQIIAGRDRESVEAYRDTPGLESLDLYRRTWEDAGGVWHVLLAGRYASVTTARQALNGLPETIREAGAWIRPLSELDTPSDNPRDP